MRRDGETGRREKRSVMDGVVTEESVSFLLIKNTVGRYFIR